MQIFSPSLILSILLCGSFWLQFLVNHEFTKMQEEGGCPFQVLHRWKRRDICGQSHLHCNTGMGCSLLELPLTALKCLCALNGPLKLEVTHLGTAADNLIKQGGYRKSALPVQPCYTVQLLPFSHVIAYGKNPDG